MPWIFLQEILFLDVGLLVVECPILSITTAYILQGG